MGYLKIGQVDLAGSFGTTDAETIWQALGKHLNIYSIEVDGHIGTFDYSWSDLDHEANQIAALRKMEKL